MKKNKSKGGLKKEYIKPTFKSTLVHFEYSIAAGSATVTPVDSSQQVQQEWDTAPDVEEDLLW